MEYEKYSRWFYAHSFYNLIWGLIVVLFPSTYFNLIGIPIPEYIALWQVVGMFVLVYSPGYYWIAKDPKGQYKLVIIAFLGTLFGPIGFAFSLMNGSLPLIFGLTIIANDLIWLPMFYFYLRKQILEKGWSTLLK